MFVIGLTGGIASGKSTVSGVLKLLGAEIIDVDSIAIELEKPHSQVWQEIVDRFGKNILAEDGSLNRRALGQIVFNNPADLNALNKIVHPRVIKRCLELIRELEGLHKTQVVVLDSALLIEAKLTELVNEVWVVSIPAELQLVRLMKRNNFSREEGIARVNSQMPMLDKLRYAHKVIDNSGTTEETKAQVESLWQELQHRIALREKPED